MTNPNKFRRALQTILNCTCAYTETFDGRSWNNKTQSYDECECVSKVDSIIELIDSEYEVWLPIADYEGNYEVSNFGRVRSLAHRTNSRFKDKLTPGKILKGEVSKNGYIRFQLSKDGVSKRFLGHRLVATAFVPNPNNKPCVNHRDNNRQNNYFNNLEWCTHRENTHHANLQNRLGVPKRPYCKNGHERKPENIGGHYQCLICGKEYKRKWWLNRKAAQRRIIKGE